MSLNHLLASVADDWLAGAACADVPKAVFFPERTADQDPVVDRWCVTCPTRGDCVTYALDNRLDDGVWGASEADRRWLRRARRGAPDRPVLELLRGRRGETLEVASGY
jgi:WhiB family redox-sensing transcriptional regulator